MDALCAQNKSIITENIPSSDHSNLNKILEIFQSSLHQNKLQIAYEVRAAVYDDMTATFSQQLSNGLEELHRSYGAALDALEQNIGHKISNIESKLQKLIIDFSHSYDNQIKSDAKLEISCDKINEIELNYNGVQQYISNFSDDYKKIDLLQRNIIDHIIEINKDISSIKAKVSDNQNFNIAIQNLKSEMNQKFVDEQSRSLNYSKALRVDLDNLLLDFKTLDESTNKFNTFAKQTVVLYKGLETGLINIDCTLQKLDGEFRSIRQRTEKLDEAEKFNHQVRNLVFGNEEMFRR